MFERQPRQTDGIERLAQDGEFAMLVRRIEVEGEPTSQEVVELSELFARKAEKYDLTPDEMAAAIDLVIARHQRYDTAGL